MILKIKKGYISDIMEILTESSKEYDFLDNEKRWYSNRDFFDLNLDRLDLDECKKVLNFLKSIRARSLTKDLAVYIDAIENIKDFNFSESNRKSKNSESVLQAFCRGLKEIILKECPHKWVFLGEVNKENEDYKKLEPYLVTNIHYVPPVLKNDFYQEDYVCMEIHNNSIDGHNKRLIYFYYGNVINNTVISCLSSKNIFLETEELFERYENEEKEFLNRRKEQCKQYKTEFYQSKSKESYFSSRIRSVSKDMDIFSFYRVINNSNRDDRSFVFEESSTMWGSFLSSDGSKEKNMIYKVPVLPYIYCWNLDRHEDCYVHVEDIKEYIYDSSLREKLVLPESHKNLLDILVDNEGILVRGGNSEDFDSIFKSEGVSLSQIKGDIVENKGNGLVVLLEGPPGCGKTLTVEVYSELIEKPLYRVSVGQLGVSPKEIESNLRTILSRANVLDCVLLIDECETFVRERGIDITQNAIVTTFLRTIEYFEGIMFLTSNKIADIDEAILSRCAAAVKYSIPTNENKRKIWKVLLKQFNLYSEDNQNTKIVSDEIIEKLLNVFPKAVGRDIKELIKLTARYCIMNNIPMDVKSFVSCAQFRYIEVDEDYYKNNIEI